MMRYMRSLPIFWSENNEGPEMAIFRVKLDYDGGKWIKNHPHPIVEVFASDAQEAAELACGMPLRRAGRAERWSRLSEQIFRVDKWSLCRG
jgi:hypothetical protein